jgi:hypothetical protein
MKKAMRIGLVPWTQRSALSAFTRVFDALWHLRSGALQSRGRSERRCLVRSRFCEAALRKSYALHRARGTKWRNLGLEAGCCGGTEQAPVTTAKAYREAITNGLS